MILKIFTLMDSSNNKNSHLGDALKQLNNAIEDWDKITSKPEAEQDVSSLTLEKNTKDLLMRLREQLNDLSKEDESPEAEKSEGPPSS